MSNAVSDADLSRLEGDGYLLVRNFLSQEDLRPLLKEIRHVGKAFGATNEKEIPNNRVDELLINVINKKPELQAYLYDRLQLMPQLLRIPSHEKVLDLARKALGEQNVGVWPRMQLRFDLAGDRENLIAWHSDYMYNEGTSHSYTFWLPLVSINNEMGPIKAVPGSHKKEYEFVHSSENRRHPLTLPATEIKNMKVIQIEQYEPGDLMIFHSKFLHSGVMNVLKDRARLVCVFRMQNINKLEILGENND